MPETPDDAAPDADTDDTAAPAQDDTAATTEPDPQELLKQIKAEARKWEQRAKENMAKLRDAEPKISEYDRLIEASKSDLERKAEEAARWQQEATQWRTAAVSSRIHSLAGDFADPEDAVSTLAAEGKYLDAGGVIDDTAIKADLAALLDRKPHWRRPQDTTKPRVPAPNAHQGSGNSGKSGTDPRQEFAALLQAGLRR